MVNKSPCININLDNNVAPIHSSLYLLVILFGIVNQVVIIITIPNV